MFGVLINNIKMSFVEEYRLQFITTMNGKVVKLSNSHGRGIVTRFWRGSSSGSH
jgi:hypothetical protein